MVVSDYTTIAEVKASLADTSWGTKYDNVLARLVTDASRAIDRMAGWDPGAFAVTADSVRYYDGSGTARQWIDPLCAEPTEVAMSMAGDPTQYTALGTVNGQIDYYGGPSNALQTGNPHYLWLDLNSGFGRYSAWYRFPRAVKITGKFGFATTCPDEIAWLTTMQAIRWFKRAQNAFADTGGIIDLGKLTHTQKVDPEIAGMIDHRFKRVAI